MILSLDADKKPLGDYLKIVDSPCPMIKGQDGGVATALLNYALSKKLVDEVVVVDKRNNEPMETRSNTYK